jgi:hypothetical protein
MQEKRGEQEMISNNPVLRKPDCLLSVKDERFREESIS